MLRNVVADEEPRIRLAISWACWALTMSAVGDALIAVHSGWNRYCSISAMVPPVRVSAAPLSELNTDGFAVTVPGCTHWPLPL